MSLYLTQEAPLLYEEFIHIIEKKYIRTLFQPIVSLYDGSILGYEALSRGPKDSCFESPVMLFDFATTHHMLWELDFLCRLKALENASLNNLDCMLFLNVDPLVINDPHFKQGFTKEFLKHYDITCHQIVFEITEQNSVSNVDAFRSIITHYKNQGYKIAIDDTGSGYSGLNLITSTHPQYIKLDMDLVRAIDTTPLKYALVKALYDFSCASNIRIIAEGIETKSELDTLIDIGIHYGQGYLLGKGKETFTPLEPGITKHIVKRVHHKNQRFSDTYLFSRVGELAETIPTLSPCATGQEALTYFESNPTLYALPVIEQQKIVGVLSREMLYSRLATRFGYDLFLGRPVSLIMDTNPLVVDYNFSVDTVSKLAMTRSQNKLYDYILVSKQTLYYGIVTVKHLLEYTTETKIQFAKHLNPLTGLPGNLLIQSRLQEVLQSQDNITVLYLDLDNFKAYNDVYGFSNGDKVITFVAQILGKVKQDFMELPLFTGHIGGDDFVVLLPSSSGAKVAEYILQSFEAYKNNFYNDKDLLLGYITSKNRKGILERFPLVALSIAGVVYSNQNFNSIYELTEMASEVKKACKEIEGSCYIIR